ncbi:aldehyde dehydrogenase family protein [Amycolatopsis thermophila]|uniref:Aldehyde dehydrogenase (NAD+) n=1 Tax=Amycolatopsis thermophila TaxID=206084 RepID=A0ABU0F614_9PSEU|nr:aldehyde dehydrogenase family protein [Amycolatopsis thermophila]MDQ0383030.1 aldehyde dehydrogenase (NAD+) [Amycolatopsis thermophila]
MTATGTTTAWDPPAAPVDPTSLAALPEVPATSRDHLDDVVARAHAAMPSWSRDSTRRAHVLRTWAEALRAEAGSLAADIVHETGKPIAEARREVAGAAGALDYNAGLTRLAGAATTTLPDGTTSRLVREPAGVTALLVPWNWPVLLLLRDLSPAFAAGVTAIVKPSPQTVHITTRVVELGHRAGVPADVLSIVYGDVAVAQHLIRHPLVRAVAFTGSTRVGERVLTAAAATMTRPLLELGGKNPAILLPDADLDTALPLLARSVVITAGQMCMACSRILVHRSIHAETTAVITEVLRGLRGGDPVDPRTELGPLISPAHAASVLGHIDRAREHSDVTGGELAHPGGIAGHVVTPAVVESPPRGAGIVTTDVFGPVVTIEPFDDAGEAADLANATPYGLVAGVWTGDGRLGHQIADAVQAGTVWINGWGASYPEIPAGGYKSSGLGRTRGVAGVHQFTEIKHIHRS